MSECGRRRWSAWCVMVGLFVGVLAAGAPPSPATADVYNPIPANQFEDPTYSFTDADAIFAYFTSDLAGGKICVIHADAEPSSCGENARIIGGQIGTGFVLMEQYPRRGQFRLLTTTMDNEPIAVSAPFTVSACGVCSRDLADSIVEQAKQAAGLMAERFAGLEMSVSMLEELAGEAIGMRGFLRKVPPDPEKIPATPTQVTYSTWFDGFGGLQLQLADPATAQITMALDLLKYVNGGAKLMYELIHADPPDPNFEQVADPVFLDLPASSPPELHDLVVSVDEQWAYAGAALSALERFQGAQLAGRRAHQIAQLEALDAMSLAVAGAMIDTVEGLRAYADVVAADPDLSGPLLTSAEKAELVALYGRIRDEGFLQAELDQMIALGYTQDDIDAVRSHFFLEIELVEPDRPAADILHEAADAVEEQFDAFVSLAREAHVVAGRIELDLDHPEASFTYTHPSKPAPTAGHPMTFWESITAHAPISARLWDWGDGTTTSNTVNPQKTFSQPGDHVVTFTVTDNQGRSGSTSQVVQVVTDGIPIAYFESPSADVDQERTFDASGSVDFDGEIVSYEWDFGDGSTGSGQVTTHTYTRIGPFVVTLTVTDDDGLTSTSTRSLAASRPADALPPVAAFDYEPFTVTAGSTVQFSNQSSQPQGRDLTWTWGYANTGTGAFGPSDEEHPQIHYPSAEWRPRHVGLTARDEGWSLQDVTRRWLQVNPYPMPSRGPCASSGGEGFDNRGTEFMLVSPERSNSSFTHPDSRFVSLLLAADTPVEGYVEVPGLDLEVEFELAAGETTEMSLPGATTQNGGVNIIGSDYVGSAGIRVCASGPVAAWYQAGEKASTDGYLALPVEHLGSRYLVSAYPQVGYSGSGGARFLASQLAIVATEDHTEVTITPSVDTDFRVAGEPYTVTLHRFYTYQLQTGPESGVYAGPADLTGTSIESSKPVAVVAGSRCSVVTNGQSCDHLLQQMTPVETWGTQHLVVSSPLHVGDLVRVLAAEDDTTIERDGEPLAQLDAGEVFEFDLEAGQAVELDSTRPVHVTQLPITTTAPDGRGDPSATNVVPTALFRAEYLVHQTEKRQNGPEWEHVEVDHWATLVVPEGSAPTCAVNGEPLGAASVAIGSSGFVAASATLPAGSHHVTCGAPFGLYLTGWAEYESYGYPGGMGVGPPVEPPPPPPDVDPPPGFNPLPPMRRFDTRDGHGGVPVGLVTPDVPLRVRFTGFNGVPTSGVGAVSLNVTATRGASPGFVTVYSCGARPLASNLNFLAAQTVANAVLAPVSTEGDVCFYAETPVHVVADVNGWFASGAGLGPLPPARRFDTRDGHGGVPVGLVTPDAPLRVRFTGFNGVPTSGVGAVSLNVTATRGASSGFVTVHPCGQRPLASSVNYPAGRAVANAVIAPVSSEGDVCFYAETPVHVVADVNGWFAVGEGFGPLPPARRFDTRDGHGGVPVGLVGPGQPVEVQIAGMAGVPGQGVGGVSLNLTVTRGAAPGFVTVYPCGPRPLASNVNYRAGQTVANAVFARLSASGRLCFYAETPVHIMADLNGWFSA